MSQGSNTSGAPSPIDGSGPDAGPGQSAADAERWQLRRAGYDPARAGRDETLFALANGTLGVRGGCEEAGGSGGGFLAEAYQRSPIHYHERFAGFASHTDTRLPVADGSGIALYVDGQRLTPTSPQCTAFERVLDLRAGHSRRVVRWDFGARGALELCAERVVPQTRSALLAIRVTLVSDGFQGRIRFESVLSADRPAPAQGDDPRIGVGAGAGMRWLLAEPAQPESWLLQASPDGGVRVACGQAHRVDAASLVGEPPELRDQRIIQNFDAVLDAGQRVVLEKFVAYAWDHHSESASVQSLRDPLSLALDEARGMGFDAILAEQAEAMADFWARASLWIDGDPHAELALRFNLFHLLQSTGRGGHTSTAAKGLTGDGYEGHYFWDTEAFMLPVLALTAPELARGMLEYRFRNLDAARRHAREMNHPRGALFPWRTIAGDECSAYYPSGSAQYHINAAIAYAIRLYDAATGDAGFMVEAGAEMLFEMARIWMQIGHFNPRRDGAFCICEVTGPDEYSALVDNNFYTNRMARAHLLDAVATWHRLADGHPDAAARLSRELALDEAEVAHWQRAAEVMYLPYDAALGIHPQDDGFLDKPVWDFANTPATHYPLLLHYHPLSLYRHQVCKQADVVQALVMDGHDIAAEVKRRCFDYYARVTVHDSTLSAAPFSILASELNLGEPAMAFLDETLRVDLDDIHGNTDHGAHMAAMAGSWLGLAFGLLGLRVRPEGPHFAPRLPARWRGYGLNLVWQGRRLRIDVDCKSAHYRLIEGAPLTVFDNRTAIALSTGGTESRALSASARWPLLPGVQPFAAVIFDLDGVLTDTAMVHFHAWKRLADELGIAFDRSINRRLKGIDRMASLDILLERAGRPFDRHEKAVLAERKNGYYREEIARFTPADLLPGARAVLDALRAAGVRVGLASASRNAPMLLGRLGIADRFDFIADPAQVAAGKPDPAIFLAAAEGLGVPPHACLGIEDAAAGIAAIKAAGMVALGIGDRRELAGADAVLEGLDQFRIETIPVIGTSGGGAARRNTGAANERVDTSDRTGTARISKNRD